MKKIWLIVIGIVVAILLIATAFGNTYNEMMVKQEAVNMEFANVDTQLQRRADLIPNLINTIKGITKHESDVYKNLADARTKYINSTSIGEKLQANTEITNSLNSLLAITESYPTLQSGSNFTNLMDELAGTENRISVARKDYNEVVQKYNTAIKKFPANMMANMFGFEPAVYFEADVADREVPNVSFE
jgi:LemA protein